MQRHSKSKYYDCELCGKIFTSNYNLKRHQQAHAKNKSYKCELCNNSFISISLLKSHCQTHIIEEAI
ncbi:unnamed protein product [Larinioides sclopetarius]|uniref:C2H2-type domain-containing protein n=6 Tax=Larinioides sclopetarius TaxID=280406 RepID=A0AAV2BV31_9ARAC